MCSWIQFGDGDILLAQTGAIPAQIRSRTDQIWQKNEFFSQPCRV